MRITSVLCNMFMRCTSSYCPPRLLHSPSYAEPGARASSHHVRRGIQESPMIRKSVTIGDQLERQQTNFARTCGAIGRKEIPGRIHKCWCSKELSCNCLRNWIVRIPFAYRNESHSWNPNAPGWCNRLNKTTIGRSQLVTRNRRIFKNVHPYYYA